MSTKKHVIEKYLPGRSFEERGNALLVPVEHGELKATFRSLKDAGLPLITLVATDERKEKNGFRVYYVFGIPRQSVFLVLFVTVHATSFPSLAREFPELALYEREILTMMGLTPEGHPDPRSLILHEENWPAHTYPLRKDFKWDTKVPPTHAGDYRFHEIGGEGVYEIPVGPVHAGIIEPGNFRFSVVGEEIIQLEARLGWVHKGIEKLFENLPPEKKVQLSERISGDSAFSHSLSYCQALENLTGTKVPARAKHLRLIFAELERLTMHIFDIGNIAGNGTGFSFMAAQGFRLTEELRRLSESLSGSRFWRNINVAGGVAKDLSPQQIDKVRTCLTYLKKEFTEIVHIADSSASLANRLEGTGVVPQQVVRDYGGVGIAARCNNIAKDARVEYPYAAYGEIAPEVALTDGGDVDARFRLRIKEVHESIRLIEKALEMLPTGAIHTTLHAIPESGMAVSVVEGWRGEIAYVIFSHEGAISRVKVRDPSFIHWQLFSHLSSQDMVPDFPLINKSFNLSYTGNDL